MLRPSSTRCISAIAHRSRAICIYDRENLCQQSRQYAARAPETRAHQRQSKARVLRAQEIEQRQRMSEYGTTESRGQWNDYVKRAYDSNHDRRWILGLCKTAALPVTEESQLRNLHKFLISFHCRYNEVFENNQGVQALRSFHEIEFRGIRLEFDNVTLGELYAAGRHLQSHAGFQRTARGLLLCCSRDGHVDATIFMLHLFLRIEEAGRQNPLSSLEGVALEKRLAAIKGSGNFRVMALRGYLAAHYGHTKDAMRYFQAALPGAVEFSKQKTDHAKTPFLAIQQHDELSSPWLELAQLAFRADDDKLLHEAFRAGTKADDPDILYQKALQERRKIAGEWMVKYENDRGQVSDEEWNKEYEQMLKMVPYPTETWLHDMSRAAASGHVDASLEMAHYYANAPAQPLPSNSEQSTSPFKLAIQLWRAFPLPSKSVQWTSPFDLFIRLCRAFDAVPPRADTEKNIEHYASLIQSPQERMRMAMYWLRIGINYGYIPSLISLAHIHICKYILPVNNLAMDIVHPELQERDDHKGKGFIKYGIDYRKTEDGIDNPYYSPRLAHDCLVTALAALATVEDASVKNDKDDRTYIQRLSVLSTFPEVVADIKIEKLRKEALEIADKCGIDIQCFDGGLVHEHKGARGQGIFESGKVERVTKFRQELIPQTGRYIVGRWKEIRDDPRVAETAGGK